MNAAIAMELLPGGTLKERLKKWALAPIEAVDALGDRVVSDSTLLTTLLSSTAISSLRTVSSMPTGTVKVGDFGLAVAALEHMQLNAWERFKHAHNSHP